MYTLHYICAHMHCNKLYENFLKQLIKCPKIASSASVFTRLCPIFNSLTPNVYTFVMAPIIHSTWWESPSIGQVIPREFPGLCVIVQLEIK